MMLLWCCYQHNLFRLLCLISFLYIIFVFFSTIFFFFMIISTLIKFFFHLLYSLSPFFFILFFHNLPSQLPFICTPLSHLSFLVKAFTLIPFSQALNNNTLQRVTVNISLRHHHNSTTSQQHHSSTKNPHHSDKA